MADFDSCFHICCETYLARRRYPVSSAAIQWVEWALKHSILAIWTPKASFSSTKVAGNSECGFAKCVWMTEVWISDFQLYYQGYVKHSSDWSKQNEQACYLVTTSLCVSTFYMWHYMTSLCVKNISGLIPQCLHSRLDHVTSFPGLLLPLEGGLGIRLYGRRVKLLTQYIRWLKHSIN